MHLKTLYLNHSTFHVRLNLASSHSSVRVDFYRQRIYNAKVDGSIVPCNRTAEKLMHLKGVGRETYPELIFCIDNIILLFILPLFPRHLLHKEFTLFQSTEHNLQ